MMRFGRVTRLAAAAGFAFGLQACVVRDTSPVNGGYGYGYGYGPNPGYQAQVSVGEPTPYSVSSMPPEPLYEQMTASPGYGYAWIDGYWHWNGYEWVWVGGRWDRQQDGYVYVQPYYDNVGGAYVYRPGYWAPHDRVPQGWQVRPNRDGRPSVVAPPPGWHTPPRGEPPPKH
jgi:YXWGXW repeat-containing protein